MQKSIKKISFLFLLILILPISAFFIYQFAALNESEKEINKIYIQQLETIIYSLNQYSEDIITNWSNEIKNILSNKEKLDSDKFIDFLNLNSSIKSILILDEQFSTSAIYGNLDLIENKNFKLSIKNSIDENKSVFNKLVTYLDVGYQKVEAIGSISDQKLNLGVFAIKNNEGNIYFCVVVFEPNEFVSKNLVAKISQACGEEFILAVVNDIDNSIIHSCDKIQSSQLTVLKPLWLIPGFSLGIKMKSGNIQDLVNQRHYENLIVLSSLLVILILGFWLIYRNLRKEIRLTQLKSDFVSNVSHELRTPLSLISMYSETLVLGRIKSDEKKREYYSVINNEANRLNKIVNSILNFSKMEAGTRIYNFADVSLVKISEDILNTYDYHIKSSGFTYSLKVNINIDNIMADTDAISESIVNLVENAIKYSGDKKEFIINIDQNKIGPFWEIKDYGIGIDKDDQNKVFDKFYRVSSGLVHTTKGTGLGLSLVKQIMEAHKGEISVTSKIGEGSIFRLQFESNFIKP